MLPALRLVHSCRQMGPPGPAGASSLPACLGCCETWPTSLTSCTANAACACGKVGVPRLRALSDATQLPLHNSKQSAEPMLCVQHGDVINITIPRPGQGGVAAPSGLGKVTVEFTEVTSAVKARNSMHGRKFAGVHSKQIRSCACLHSAEGPRLGSCRGQPAQSRPATARTGASLPVGRCLAEHAGSGCQNFCWLCLSASPRGPRTRPALDGSQSCSVLAASSRRPAS